MTRAEFRNYKAAKQRAYRAPGYKRRLTPNRYQHVGGRWAAIVRQYLPLLNWRERKAQAEKQFLKLTEGM